ncbi:nuclear factor 1 B-type isoform X1 [Tachysurus ichikawai]
MKAPEKAMAGKTADGSIKWQLCYDMTARTWWMEAPGWLALYSWETDVSLCAGSEQSGLQTMLLLSRPNVGQRLA